MDIGDEYERARARFVVTVRDAGDAALELQVPATPDWSVGDALAHVVGLCADLNALRLPGADDPGGNGWTARQVNDRRGRHVEELIGEWDREAPVFAAGLRAFGYDFGCHFVADLHAHHQDVRVALDLPPDDDPVTVAVALDHYLAFTDEVLRGAQWGTLAVDTGTNVRMVGGGDGAPRATVRATPFDLLRSLSARRTHQQVLALHWEGDVGGAIDVVAAGFAGNYAFPDREIEPVGCSSGSE